VSMKETPAVTIATLAAIGEKLGVPAFVIVVLLLTVIPRIDRGLMVADRVDAELQVVISRCGFAP
jgi:hypothetical protein